MTDEAQDPKNALGQNVTLSDGLGYKTYYILITIDLAEQKAVGVKFCETQEQLTFFQEMFKNDFGDGYVTFAHAYENAGGKASA
jgi:hypothetical protein